MPVSRRSDRQIIFVVYEFARAGVAASPRDCRDCPGWQWREVHSVCRLIAIFAGAAGFARSAPSVLLPRCPAFSNSGVRFLKRSHASVERPNAITIVVRAAFASTRNGAPEIGD